MEIIIHLHDYISVIDHITDQNILHPGGDQDFVNNNLIGWQPMDEAFQSRLFLNKNYIYWLSDQNIHYNDLINILPEDASVRNMIKYCVYVKSNCLIENNIIYEDFLDHLLGNLNIENDDFQGIFNNPAFESYIPSLLRQIDVYAGIIQNEIPGTYNFKVVNPEKFAEKILDIYNYEQTTDVGQAKVRKYISEAVQDLNKISRQPIEVKDIVPTPNTVIVIKKALIVMGLGIFSYYVSGIVTLPTIL
jgi:hypothetical protein